MAVRLNEDLFSNLKIKMKWSISGDIYKLLPKLDDDDSMDVTLSKEDKDDLAYKVQSLLFPTMSAKDDKDSVIIMDSIRYFVELPSISILLRDWLHDESTIYNLISNEYPNYVTPKPLFRDFILRLYTVSRSLQYLHLVTTYTNNCAVMLSTACKAMKIFQMILDDEMKNSMSEYISLCTFCLKYAMETKHWQIAFQSCCYHPYSPTKGIPDLVVTMVQHGAIRDFLLLSKDLLQNHDDGMIYFDVVGHALYDVYSREQDYANSLMYLEALYTLFVYHNHWKKASYVMNIIYHHQLREYTAKVKKSSITSKDDIYLSAMACYHSICLIEDDVQKYLITSKTLGDVSLSVIKDDYLYLSNDLELRMMVALALVYYENEMKDKVEETTEYHHYADTNTILYDVKNVVSVLAEKGCFGLAVLLAKKASEKIKTNGAYDILLQEIFCQYLVPFAVVLSRPTPINASDSNKEYESTIYDKVPDLSTLSAQLSTSTNAKCGTTPFIQTDEWRPSIDNRMSQLKGLICTKLLQNYLVKAPPTAVLDVAEKMLVMDDGMSSLPTWLLQLFQPLYGSFASFPSSTKDNSITNNSGNPTDLLRLYIRHGMYTTACNYVTTILSLPKKSSSNGMKRTMLPEKGDIEYVPYNDIDKLWKITSYCLKVHLLDDSSVERKELTDARESMKIALIRHFKHLKESDTGRMSARVLIRR